MLPMREVGQNLTDTCPMERRPIILAFCFIFLSRYVGHLNNIISKQRKPTA